MTASRAALQALVGRVIGPLPYRWGVREAILYALAAGAGQDEVEHVFEGYGPQLLPTFGIVAAGFWTPAVSDLLPAGTHHVYAGFEYEFLRPVAVEGELSTSVAVESVEFRERSALLWLRGESFGADGMATVRSRHPLHVTVEPGPATAGHRLPAAEPYESVPEPSVEIRVDPRATLIFHLLLPIRAGSPISDSFHIDPKEAEARGLPGTFLHGGGVTGHIGLALARLSKRHGLGRLTSVAGRFAAPVFPGDTLQVAFRRPADPRNPWLFAVTRQDGREVVKGGRAAFAPA